MSGHSKWSQIKHKKALTDKKKSQLFSKLSKLISIAARKGTNPETNLDLRSIIDKAKSMNMPNDNIQRAVNRLADKSSQLEELTIDGIGPGGVALEIKAITDNRNRTIAEVKKILNEHNSKMVPPGSISWMFNQPPSQINEEISKDLDILFEALDDNDDVDDIKTNLP